MVEIRCKSKLHAEVSVDATGTLWKYCDSGYCRNSKDEIVIHEFNLEKRSEDGTKIYPTDTQRIKKTGFERNQ